MKKLLFVLALGAFAACGDGTTTDDNDTNTDVYEDTATAPMTMDTTTMGTDTARVDSIR